MLDVRKAASVLGILLVRAGRPTDRMVWTEASGRFSRGALAKQPDVLLRADGELGRSDEPLEHFVGEQAAASREADGVAVFLKERNGE